MTWYKKHEKHHEIYLHWHSGIPLSETISGQVRNIHFLNFASCELLKQTVLFLSMIKECLKLSSRINA